MYIIYPLQSDPIVKAGGLQAMLGTFLKHNKDVFKKFKAHLKDKDSGKKEKKVNGKKAAKKVESSSDDSDSSDDEKKAKSSSSDLSDSEVDKKKKLVGNKRTKKEDTSSSDSDSSSDDEKAKKPVTKRQRADSISERTRARSNDYSHIKKPTGPIKPLNF